MALISCPECGKEISDKAFACPHCGNPMNQPTPKHTNNNGWSNGSKKRLLYVLIGLILICIIGGAWFLLRSGNEPAYKEIDISELDSIFSIENIDEAASNEFADGEVGGETRLEKHDVIETHFKKDSLYMLAEQGDADAQYKIGYRYYVGDRVSKDKSKAVYWFRKSAEQGYRFALYKLGFCYYHGEGVSEDYSKAVSWFHKAAYLHDIAAYYYLGICYKNGDGVPKDYSKAVSWFRKAADQGYADAQYHLGLCYDNGEGVPKDKSEAEYWFRKAAKGGNSKAKSKLENINKNEKSQKKNDVVKQEKSQVSSSKSESSTSSSRSISSNESSSELPNVISFSIDKAIVTKKDNGVETKQKIDVSQLKIYRSGLVKYGNDHKIFKTNEFDSAVLHELHPDVALFENSDIPGASFVFNSIDNIIEYYLISDLDNLFNLTMYCKESESSKLKKIVQLVKQGKFIKK